MALPISEVQKAYIAFFNRPADVSGLAFWQAADDLRGVFDLFSTSPEYTETYAGLDPTATITKIYDNLFGRAPDDEGLAFWVEALESGRMTISNAAHIILNAARNDDGLGTRDLDVITNKIAAAVSFTQSLDTPLKEATYLNAALANNDGFGPIAILPAKAWLAAVNETSQSLDAAVAALTAENFPYAGRSVADMVDSVLDSVLDSPLWNDLGGGIKWIEPGNNWISPLDRIKALEVTEGSYAQVVEWVIVSNGVTEVGATYEYSIFDSVNLL
jgi:hypothetical protein